MGLSYNDLNLLRLIQKRQLISLPRAAQQIGKNESSIRRTIEQINLYSDHPLIEVRKNYCISHISYRELVDFVGRISMSDYASSCPERIRVMIVTTFFQGYVNASALYEEWGLSLTTKKQDTAQLRLLLKEHGLKLVILKKKGLAIEGDELQLRFLVINILHPLLEFTAENRMEARLANTPLEKQTCDLAFRTLEPVCTKAVEQLNRFLSEHTLSLNYPSKKFLLLFICLMEIRPPHEEMNFSYRLPLSPLHIHFTDEPRLNRLYSVAISMMNFSRNLDFPFDRQLWHTTERFTEQVVATLPNPFFIQEEFLRELYCYFYREITLDHFHCTFVDKTVENTKEEFSELYETILRYSLLFQASYNFTFMDEHLSTLTLLIEKHILRNRLVDKNRRRVVIVTSINFERISFFLEQVREKINLTWVDTLNINETDRLEKLDYDYIFCFSTRIYNLLHAQKLPVIKLNFFIRPEEVEMLLGLGFTTLKHRFRASSFVLELAGKSEAEMVEYLKREYGDHFV